LLRVVAQQPKKVANGVKNRAKVAQRRQEKGSHQCKPFMCVATLSLQVIPATSFTVFD
jgi:hypothetical protein